MINLINAMDMASEFIQNTWVAVVRGDNQVPGAPSLRFDTITQRNLYADSIVQGTAFDMPEAGEFNRKVIATDKLAEKTEEGYPAWDMKPMLLGGPKARRSKSGTLFNIIPFRHGTGGKSENAQFRPMPKNIHEAAKALKPSLASDTRILKYGGKLNQKDHGAILGQPQTKTIPGHGSYTHKNPIHEGMLKVQASYAKGAQSKYLTFRLVSDKSDPLSWWHPGRPAQPHIQFVVDYCLPAIERNLKAAAQSDFLTFKGVGMDITVN
jgi:hypothetical protein